MYSGGLIAISAECEHIDGRDWLRIAVSDTGIGIKPEDVARAFQPLTQLDGSTTRAQGGMGMGLAIAKRMAQALGGDIMVASEPGKGSTFTLRVPLRLDEVKASEGELLLRRLGAAA